MPSEVNLQCKGALGAACDALYGKPLTIPRMNWEQGLSCVILQAVPAPSLPALLAADWAVAAAALCSTQTPEVPARHQMCSSRSLEVTVPLFLLLAPQVSCLPDPSSGPQAAAIGTHVSNPTGSPTAPCWSEDSDRSSAQMTAQ